MDSIVGSVRTEQIFHEELIGKLDKASEQFNVLIIKTDLILSYTSAFLSWIAGIGMQT